MQGGGDFFDFLVADITVDDRMAILQKMKTQIEPERELLVRDARKEEVAIPVTSNIKNESFIVRIVLFFKSMFSSKNIEVVYSEHKLSIMAKRLESKFPNYFKFQSMSLEHAFYEALIELKRIADYFKVGVAHYDEQAGEFLVLLGSLIMSDMEKKIESVANPYSIPFTQEITPDLRTSLIRKMDTVLASVSSQDRLDLYTCVQSLMWLRAFTQLPFDSFLARFNDSSRGTLRCVAATAVHDLEKFANILCNAKNIEPEVIEALYLFQTQSQIKAGDASVNVKEGVSDHMEASLTALKGITYFINTIPLRSLTMVSKRSLSWAPMYKDSGEDWFVQYKTQWKRIFDRKWSQWLNDRKLILTKEKVTQFCQTEDYPVFQNRPWKTLDSKIVFSKEYSLGFLNAFFTKVFPKYNEILKILMVDGDFIINENKTEFTDTYTEANHLAQSIRELNAKLAPKGAYGEGFSSITAGILRTVQGQLQIKTMMTSIESEVELLILTFGRVCRSFNSIFSGILVANYNSSYDTITNIASLVGPDNAPIRKHFVEVSDVIETALNLLQDIEAVELEGSSNAK